MALDATRRRHVDDPPRSGGTIRIRITGRAGGIKVIPLRRQTDDPFRDRSVGRNTARRIAACISSFSIDPTMVALRNEMTSLVSLRAPIMSLNAAKSET